MYRTRLQHYFIFFEQVNFIIVFCGHTAIMSTAGSSPTPLALPGAPSPPLHPGAIPPPHIALRGLRAPLPKFTPPSRVTNTQPSGLTPHRPSLTNPRLTKVMHPLPSPSNLRQPLWRLRNPPSRLSSRSWKSPEGEEAKETKDEKGRARGKRDEMSQDHELNATHYYHFQQPRE